MEQQRRYSLGAAELQLLSQAFLRTSSPVRPGIFFEFGQKNRLTVAFADL
jgi:hypothetical protein